MPRNDKPETIFTVVGFRSPYPETRLQTIEVFGVPGQKLRSGEYVVSDKLQRFFDDLIVQKIFRKSLDLSDCNFKSLKIWLYDTETRDDERGYDVPLVDRRDLKIHRNLPGSKLEEIYVLDNELKGREYDLWKNNAQQLFTPLFTEFITPPELPSFMVNNRLGKFLQEVDERIDPHKKIKHKIFFNALIIQID
ncbi:MAG: hypothetical protein VKL59_10575 [Nostocaceae cyanobacterium]|nr:hypothetical protein [Nostocaceae cyanobacterium]